MFCSRIDSLDKAELAVMDVMQTPGELLYQSTIPGPDGAAFMKYYKRIHRAADGSCTDAGSGLSSCLLPQGKLCICNFSGCQSK